MDVSLVSTPSDGTCGIGTYAGDLSDNFSSDTSITRHTLSVDALNPLHFIAVALAAGLSGDDIIHIQHEYGLYGPFSYATFLFFPIVTFLARLRQTPVVVTIHSAWNHGTVDTPPIWLKQTYINLVNRTVVMSSDHVIFLSKNCMEEFNKSVDTQNFSIFPHGVNEPKRESRNAADAKRAFGYDPKSTVVTLPGYVRPEKGTKSFIDLARRVDNIQFLVAGGVRLDGLVDYFESIEKSAPQNVKITGVLDNDRFQDAFLASDIIILPYTEMTQSGIFNWCAAYGIPVLASNHTYFERLEDEWNCVETAQMEDIDSFETKLRALINSSERRGELSSAILTYANNNSFEYVSKCHHGLYRWMKNEEKRSNNRMYRLIQWVYDRTIRERVPRKIASLNGIPVRYSRLFDSKDLIPDYENPNVVGLNNHVDEGDSVTIIGGGWGVTGVIAARQAGDAGDVTIYEASSEYANNVRETAILAGVANRISVIERTVGEGVFAFGEDDTDQYSPADIPECDLLEIDAEGAEIDILTEISVRPETIIVETHGCYAAPTAQVELLLEQKGYEVISKEAELADRGVDVLVAKYLSPSD